MAYEVPITPYNPPQNDPLQSVGRLMQLRSLMNQQALQKQELAGGELENQQRQIALQQQQAGMEAMKQWDGKNYDDLPDLMAKNGASLQTVMSAKAGIVKYKQDLASLTKDQLANEKTINDRLAGLVDTVKSMPPEQQAQGFESIKPQAAALLKDNPQRAQQIMGMQYQGPDQLDLMEKSLMGHDALLADALKTAQTGEAGARAKEAEAQTAKIQQETATGEGAYRQTLQKLESNQPVTPQEMANARAFEASQTKSSTTADSLGITQSNTSAPRGLAAAMQKGKTAAAAGGGGAGGGQAVAKDNLVDAIGQYKMDPMLMGRALYKHPELLGLLHEKYPDWDQTAYNAKNKLIQGYTSGTQSKEINAINTAMGHVRVLDDAVDALNNGNLTALNKLGNSLGINVTGQTAAAAFKLIVNRVGPEISSAYIPGGGGEHERFANQADFSADLPPQTLHNNAAVTVKLLRSKVGSLENQYKNTVGRDDFQQKFITPEAQAAFQKFSGGGKGGAAIFARDPQGNLHQAPAGTPLPKGWTLENRQ